MSLKTILLTTDTAHHRYYILELIKRFSLQAVFVETRSLVAPFETFHPFEKMRDEYESDVLLAGAKTTLTDMAETRMFESVNSKESVDALRSLAPDVVIVFGTGKLFAPAIESPSIACLNLHGGNPEHYRGLDSHLWAVYHRDFDNLVTTLHYVDAAFDTGDIVAQTQLRLTKGMRLFQLRSINTHACVDLSLFALASLDATGRLPCRKQVLTGRYYSFMPSVLKEECVKKFSRHVSPL
jgi:methionyl-tRNA formyltransferase